MNKYAIVDVLTGERRSPKTENYDLLYRTLLRWRADKVENYLDLAIVAV